MSQTANTAIAVIGIDIGKNSFHLVGHDARGAIVLRQKWSRGQVEARLANIPPCLIGMEACVGAHHLSRKLASLGHDARLMPAKYVRPYSKGQKNDFNDAEAIAEAVQRPGRSCDLYARRDCYRTRFFQCRAECCTAFVGSDRPEGGFRRGDRRSSPWSNAWPVRSRLHDMGNHLLAA